MRAIILAAGSGRRLAPYALNTPKCLLPFAGRTLLDWQAAALRSGGVQEIVLVKGFCADQFSDLPFRQFENRAFAATNMVASLLCAEATFDEDAVVSYGDIVYQADHVRELVSSTPKDEVRVIVDPRWEEYYVRRYGKLEEDLESLRWDERLAITDIGEKLTHPDGIQARYVGLLWFSTEVLRFIRQRLATPFQPDRPFLRARTLGTAYMTDLLQYLIDAGVLVRAVPVPGGWLEFDTATDYELACRWLADGSIGTLWSPP